MDKFLVKEFKGIKIYNFIWKDKICWIGIDVANLLGYKNHSKAIAHCITAERFEVGKEYDVLKQNDLKKLKKVIFTEDRTSKFLKAPQITILYEEGLYGFLQYSGTDIAIEFKKWVRREVIPSIRETGGYNAYQPIVKGNQNFNIENFKIAYEASTMFSKTMDELDYTAEEKLRLFKYLYERANIQIPLEIRTE